jgi:hypothetical protein
MVRGAFLVAFIATTSGCGFDTSATVESVGAKDGAPTADVDPSPIPDANAQDATPGFDRTSGSDAAPPVEIRLNINGPAHTGITYPGAWSADPGFGGACEPQYYSNVSPVANTVDDVLFHDIAYGNQLNCELGDGMLPAGNYRVGLYFAEIYYGPGCPGGGGAGSRIFDIQLEGQLVASDIDIFQIAGGCTENGGGHHVASFEVLISDGTLNIYMPTSTVWSMIAAIELISLP